MPSKNGDTLKHPRRAGGPPAATSPGEAAPRRRGRPRQVTEEEALEAAMRVFWSEGYDGASMDRLSREMGMPRATIYQSFRDKEGLFLSVIAHFGRTQMVDPLVALQSSGPMRQVLERFYDAVILMALSDKTAPGCLIASSLSAAAGSNLRLRAELSREYDEVEKYLAKRFATARDELIVPQTPPEALALMVASVARGLMLRARAGADREAMMAAARAAIDAICAPEDPSADVGAA